MIPTLACFLILTATGPPPLAIHTDLANAMASGTYVPNSAPSAPEYHYRLFEPHHSDHSSGETFPLVMWLHGYGDYEYRHANMGQLVYTELLLGRVDRIRENRFYMLALQLPTQQTWCNIQTPEAGRPDALDHLWDLVADLQRTKPIDPQRICVVGISGGGQACWEMIRRYPGKIAAAAPLACEPPWPQSERGAAPTPTWTFVSEHDTSLSIDRIRTTMDELKGQGAKVQLTIIPGHAHNSWGPAFSDYPLAQWLLSRELGSWNWRPPRNDAGKWWPTWTQVAVPAAICAGVWQKWGRWWSGRKWMKRCTTRK